MSGILAVKRRGTNEEKLISENKNLKTNIRNSFNFDTENFNTFIYSNISVLENCESRHTIVIRLNNKERRAKQ